MNSGQPRSFQEARARSQYERWEFSVKVVPHWRGILLWIAVEEIPLKEKKGREDGSPRTRSMRSDPIHAQRWRECVFS